MKIIIDRLPLFEVVSTAARAVSSKATIPVLEGVLLKAQVGELTVSGYDLELGITTTVPANVKEEGEIVISARLFLDILRKLRSDDVSISVNDKLLVEIKGGSSEFSVLGLPPDEYPELPVVYESQSVTMQSSIIKDMIERTLFAVSVNDSKPVHTGSLFDIREDTVRVVSVDGFRLALRKEILENPEPMSFVVPGKSLSEIVRLLADDESPVTLSISKKHIVLKVGGYSIISRLIEGEFLDYEKAVPDSAGTEVTVSVASLTDAVEGASVLISDRLKSPVRIDFKDDSMDISAATALGSSFDSIPCSVSGETFTIGFNNRYLLDALRACKCEQVKLLAGGPLAPMRIVPLEGDSFCFLVLPVRLKTE